MRIVKGLLALVAVAALAGCAARRGVYSQGPATPYDLCCNSQGVPELEAGPLGPCTLSGTAYVNQVATEGVVIRLYYLDEQKGCAARPHAYAITDQKGQYVFRNLPAAESPREVRIIAAYLPGCYCLVRQLSLSPAQPTVCDLFVSESPGGEVYAIGSGSNIDPTKAGAGAVVTADPKTGEPTYHPY